MAEETNSQQDMLSKVKNPVLYIVMMFAMSGGFKYFEPVIDHALGRDKAEQAKQEEEMRQYINSRFSEVDSTIQVGVNMINLLNSEVDDINMRSAKWRNMPFTFGLKSKQGTDSLWYRGQNGITYVATYDPIHMWWKYIDPNDWQSPHKAAFFEIPWNEFEDRQTKMWEAMLYYEELGNQ